MPHDCSRCYPPNDTLYNVLVQLKAKDPKRLSGGAYKIDDKRVLKFTPSKGEFKLAQKLFEGNFPYLFKPLDLFSLAEDDNYIVMPLYKQLNARESKELNSFLGPWPLNLQQRPWANHRNNHIVKKFNLNEIRDDLRRLGIKHCDDHAGNFVKDGNKYIMIDCVYYP